MQTLIIRIIVVLEDIEKRKTQVIKAIFIMLILALFTCLAIY